MARVQDRNVVLTAGGLEALVRNPLSKIEHGLLWKLASTLPPAGDIIAQTRLAEELAATPRHINRAMQRLCVAGIVMRGVRAGLSYHYKLNPAYFRILM